MPRELPSKNGPRVSLDMAPRGRRVSRRSKRRALTEPGVLPALLPRRTWRRRGWRKRAGSRARLRAGDAATKGTPGAGWAVKGQAGGAGAGRSRDVEPLGSSARGHACVPTGLAGMEAAHRAASARAEAGDTAGIAAWAAGCGCARGVSAWHCSSVRIISAFTRDSATVLPCQRIATLSGTSGSMARRKHSMAP